MAVHYEIRLRAGDAACCAGHFDDLDVRTDGAVPFMQGELDQAALHGLLERVRFLRLDLLDVRGGPSDRTHPAEAGTTRSPYEIRVVGALGPAGRDAFADLAVDVEPTATVLSGELSEAFAE